MKINSLASSLPLIAAVLILLAQTNALATSRGVSTSTKTASSLVQKRDSASEEKRPNPVRRLFSWMKQTVTRPFRRSQPFICYLPPTISAIHLSDSIITLPCPPNTSGSDAQCMDGTEVNIEATASHDEEVAFTWAVTAGRLKSEGSRVIWDLSGVPEGVYTVTAEMRDPRFGVATGSASIKVERCKDCRQIPPRH